MPGGKIVSFPIQPLFQPLTDDRLRWIRALGCEYRSQLELAYLDLQNGMPYVETNLRLLGSSAPAMREAIYDEEE